MFIDHDHQHLRMPPNDNWRRANCISQVSESSMSVFHDCRLHDIGHLRGVAKTPFEDEEVSTSSTFKKRGPIQEEVPVIDGKNWESSIK